MEADIPHHDDVAVPLDAKTLALSQHEWLQFEPESAATMRCRRILRMSVATPRCIDRGVLADAGQAELARAILGEDTPWTRLFNIAELPTDRLITVEFLLTFRYRALQTAVREQEDEELPLNIEFSLCRQHMEMSIERFAMHLGIYYEPDTVCDTFTLGLTQGEDKGSSQFRGLILADYKIKWREAVNNEPPQAYGQEGGASLKPVVDCHNRFFR
ncbi:hypothetical protein E3N88_13824 [Mikania micrantha]|uniref:Uncharacterized protein n=1 Tax=Mikania micrantha TaxID=192012 RepID=A0A5N6NZQ0_9ASTR|nr:hypothetical protein E3N88_13824 [Mikania micrantha]